MSFEIQELPDVIKVFILLSLGKEVKLHKILLKKRIDKVCAGRVCIEMDDLEKALKEMISEGLILEDDNVVRLTPQGQKLSGEWESLLLKKDPIIEVVAGLVDGSITGLVVVLSTFVSGLASKAAAFAALLTLTAVAITNFSSCYVNVFVSVNQEPKQHNQPSSKPQPSPPKKTQPNPYAFPPST